MSKFILDDKTIVIIPSQKNSNDKQTVTLYSVQNGTIVSITKEVPNDLVEIIKSIQDTREEIEYHKKNDTIIDTMNNINECENYPTRDIVANWGIPEKEAKEEQKPKSKEEQELDGKTQKVKNYFVNLSTKDIYQLPAGIKAMEFIDAIEEDNVTTASSYYFCLISKNKEDFERLCLSVIPKLEIEQVANKKNLTKIITNSI